MWRNKISFVLDYVVAAIVGGLGGGLIGYLMVYCNYLLERLIAGYYVESDFFVAVQSGMIAGRPIGAIVGASVSIFLVSRSSKNSRFIYLAILFSLGFFLSLSFYLDGRLRPPLVKAAQQNNLEQIQIAIEKSVDLNARDIKGRTALMAAISTDNLEIAQLLIQAGADVNAKDDKGWTALRIAATRDNNDAITQTLIEHGAYKFNPD